MDIKNKLLKYLTDKDFEVTYRDDGSYWISYFYQKNCISRVMCMEIYLNEKIDIYSSIISDITDLDYTDNSFNLVCQIVENFLRKN